MSSPPPKRVFVFDSPRCCSHLFRKLFSAHPQLTHIDVPFFAPWMGPESITRKIVHNPEASQFLQEMAAKAPLTTTLGTTYAEAAAKLVQTIRDAESGKAVSSSISGLPELTRDASRNSADNIVMIQDHAPFTMQSSVILSVLRDQDSPYRTPGKLSATENPTHIPEDVLATTTPIFLIRNPLLTVPSMYRVQKPWTKNNPMDDEFRILSSQMWTRILFDWFKARGQNALVVDAGDIIADPANQTAFICKAIGIDPAGVQTTWAALPVDQQPQDKMMQDYMRQIWASTGVIPSAKKELGLDGEMAKWLEEFGPDTAGQIRQRVEEEMANYNHLRGAVIEV